MGMFEWNSKLRAHKIDGIWVKTTELSELNSDLTCAVAAWRRQRREEALKTVTPVETIQEWEKPLSLIEQVTEDCVREVITEVVSSITESNRNTNLIALKCRMRELHGIGRPKGRRHL